jgi:hypothetical protein
MLMLHGHGHALHAACYEMDTADWDTGERAEDEASSVRSIWHMILYGK